MMNIDRILQTMNDHGVDYLLIGGMNFLLRHEPVLTYDVDLWIEESDENRRRCEKALAALNAEWGASDDDWGPVVDKGPGMLDRQGVFCLGSPHGAIDVFRSVRGLEDWQTCAAKSILGSTANGTNYRGLCDQDMLQCQMALDESQRKPDRIAVLKRSISGDIDG